MCPIRFHSILPFQFANAWTIFFNYVFASTNSVRHVYSVVFFMSFVGSVDDVVIIQPLHQLYSMCSVCYTSKLCNNDNNKNRSTRSFTLQKCEITSTDKVCLYYFCLVFRWPGNGLSRRKYKAIRAIIIRSVLFCVLSQRFYPSRQQGTLSAFLWPSTQRFPLTDISLTDRFKQRPNNWMAKYIKMTSINLDAPIKSAYRLKPRQSFGKKRKESKDHTRLDGRESRTIKYVRC